MYKSIAFVSPPSFYQLTLQEAADGSVSLRPLLLLMCLVQIPYFLTLWTTPGVSWRQPRRREESGLVEGPVDPRGSERRVQGPGRYACSPCRCSLGQSFSLFFLMITLAFEFIIFGYKGKPGF